MGADVRDDFRGGGGVFGADVRGQTFIHSPLTPETGAADESKSHAPNSRPVSGLAVADRKTRGESCVSPALHDWHDLLVTLHFAVSARRVADDR